MKRSKLLMLLSGAIMMFAAMAFTSCVDDNDDLGMPYLEVSPDVLKFDANGTAIGASEFIVKSNRPWTLDIPEGAEWVRASALSGEGDGTVSFNLFASTTGQSATLTFSLKNSAGYAYLKQEVNIIQGDAPVQGPVGDLVEYMKTLSAGALNYPVETIEAVILANNEYGNNFGKLYVGDNTNLPNSATILYSTTEFTKANSAKYPVGKKVTLNLKDAEYAPYQNLRELKNVTVTVSAEDAVDLVVPVLTAAQFLKGEYQGQYVKITNVTPQATFVGQAWATSAKRAVKMDSNGSELQSYMSTATDASDFATMMIAAKTGAIFGAAEQIGTTIQIIPTKPEDVAELSDGGDEPAVTTGAASELTTTGATLAGSSRNIDAATEVGVEYKVATAADWIKKAAAVTSADWSVVLTALTENTQYAYRAYAVSAGTTLYGAEKTFSTKSSSSGDIMVDFTVLADYPSGFPTAKGTGTLATYKFGGYDFQFFGVVQTDGSGGYYSSTFSGATSLLWGKKGAYIGLPAVAGKALSKVVCTVPDGASGAVQVGIYDAADAAVTGGEAITWTKESSPRVYTYNLSNTTANTSYRLYINSAHNSQLSQLELYYGEGSSDPKPALAPATATMNFTSEADATGKTQAYTLTNATGLTLFADVADKTNFSAAVESGNTVRVKALSANSAAAARTTTVTAYLADGAAGERKATATINVSQAGSTPSGATLISIPDLVAKIGDTAMSAAVVLDADVDYYIEGVVMNDVTGGNYSFNNLILATEGATAQHNGVTLYGSQVEPSTLGLDKGDRVKVTLLKGLAKIQNFNGLYEVTGDKAATWCNVEKLSGTATVTPVVIPSSQLAAYQGMAVKINGATTTDAGVWANATAVSSHTLTAAGGNLTVFCKINATAFVDQPYAATTADIMGLATNGKYGAQLVPRNMADVAGFTPTGPVITGLTPDALTWASTETNAQTIAVDGSNLSGGLSATSSAGADSKFTIAVSGTTLTVNPKGTNATSADFSETLTVSVAGGNSKTALLTQSKANSSGGGAKWVEVTSAPADWSGDYLIVYKTGSRILKGSLPMTGSPYLDSSNNFVEVTINNSEIANSADIESNKFVVEKMDGGYSIKTGKDGYYIAGKSASNTLVMSATPGVNTFEIVADGVKIISETSVLVYNTTSGQDRFRYYKSTSWANYGMVTLYKYTE